MDRRILEQLSQLERGARDVQPHGRANMNGGYHTSQYHTDDVYDQQSRQYYPSDVSNRSRYDTFAEGRSFHQPVYDQGYDQELAYHDERRPCHVQQRSPNDSYRNSTQYDEPAPSRTADLFSQFAFEPNKVLPTSSSPRLPPSSPSFVASQRRMAPSTYVRQERTPYNSISTASVQQSTVSHTALGSMHEERGAVEAMVLQAQPTTRHAQPENVVDQRGPSLGPPVVQGIQLISTRELPDRTRKIFPYPNFNAVQSKSFGVIYRTNDNFVLSSPTGSGKTAVLELAICRLVTNFSNGSYKIVYMAPTKSLCSERQRDWQAKFAHLDLQCAELTGDTEHAQLRNVQHASIIITTPEKWDSMTRKWKDHQKLMEMVKLFLIDEVHILKEDRGASLEAVVSRMKSIGTDVRFVALSATVPNSQDIATWLGKDTNNPHIPAARERLGEEFRPVPLRKHVCGYNSPGNDFAFDKTLNGKLPDVIAKFSHRKPLMVFCFTRKSCEDTAKLLARWWSTSDARSRYWESPLHRVTVDNKDLREIIPAGVAYHHAGLSLEDRLAIEKGYLAGDINVICCTSTLAVGVNLPCHMVIIKNTITYQSTGVCKEYSDLEVMQMLGRAGRPQFDNNALAVIMTRLSQVPVYEKMISGQEVLESCLHRNLIDHLNAEIGLGSITSVQSAKKWLSGTFLYVRLKENPEHYKIESDAPGRNLDERLENICSKAIELLKQTELIDGEPRLKCTEFGDAMARYYLQFETMRNFLALPPRAKISEILSALTQAAEFKDIRFRSGEKPVYKELNKNSSIKFPIPVNIDLTAHKVSLVIQSILGGIELPDENGKHRVEYNTCKSTIFQHGHRLIRCIVDCQLHLNDSTSARNALMLARSLASQVWDDSPLTLKQLEGIGIVAVRKLANNDVRSIEDLETTEPHRIETMLSRNPPFGTLVQNRAKAFPKLRIEMKAMGEPIVKKGECVTLNVKAEIGFMNEQIPEMFQRKPVYVCVLVETSDGRKSYFARVSAKKLNRGQDVLFSADLTAASQVVRGYIMCDEIAGTQRIATLKPDIPAFMFPTPQRVEELNKQRTASTTVPITTKLRAESGSKPRPVDDDRDGPGANVLNELDLTEADDFVNINDLDENGNMRSNSSTKGAFDSAQPTSFKEPVRLENGKWACNHPCKNKSACKHTCCKEGTDNKPKPPKAKAPKKADSGADLKQTQLDVSRTKKPGTSTVAISSSMDLSIAPRQKSDSSKEVKSLNQLHDNTVNSTRPILLLGNSRSTDETTLSTFRPAQTFLGSGRPASTSKDDDDFSDDFGLEDFDPDDFLLGLDPQGPAEKKGGSQAVDLNEEDMLDFDPEDELVAFEHPSTEDAVDTMNSPFVEDECEMAPATTWSDDGRMYNEGDDESENVGHSAQHEAPSSSEPGSVNLINSKSRDKGLFVTGESSDTASNQQPSSSSTARSESSQKRNLDFDDFIDADVSLRPIKKPKQFSEDTTALPGNDFFDEVAASAANKEKEKSDEDDDAGKWFKEMFGTEMFEYVG